MKFEILESLLISDFNTKKISSFKHRGQENKSEIDKIKLQQYLYSVVIRTLLYALNLREHETHRHSCRVTEYTLAISRKLNLSNDELLVYRSGALLHDVGKIGVSDSILLKPSKLNSVEWNAIKKHPEYGFKILKGLSLPDEVSNLVYSHHERYDGKGYPNGSKGSRIPLGARIFSIADAFDAMTSYRVYRSSISFDEAKEIIKKSSGSQFDPEIVDIFLNISNDELAKISKEAHKQF
jgi:putative nucleotidyltransferase with HDIG domain